MADRAYTVTGQNQVRGLVNGQLVDLYEISYAGPNGITGQVRLPVAGASAGAVDEAIRRRLDEQLQIAQLGQS